MKKFLVILSLLACVNLHADSFDKKIANITMDAMMDMLSAVIFATAQEEGLSECVRYSDRLKGCYDVTYYPRSDKIRQIALYESGDVAGFFKVLHENALAPRDKTGIIFCDMSEESCETFEIIDGETIENKFVGRKAWALIDEHLE